MIALYTKFKYYIGWTLAEASCIASGQSYDGEEKGVAKFDRFYSIRPKVVEFGVFTFASTEEWNHNAHMWLKRYLYFRMNSWINREVALYLTYMISAFWHGFYPVYFITFLLYSIFTETSKEIYSACCKYSFMRSPPILILIYIFTQYGLDYLGILFDLLLFGRVKIFMTQIYWIPALYIILLLGFKLTCKYSNN
jgi:hypothetical protein